MSIYDQNENQFLFRNMKFQEAISHLIHSRTFEILGYLALIKRENLLINDQNKSDELLDLLEKTEEITKKMLKEFHDYMEYYMESNEAQQVN